MGLVGPRIGAGMTRIEVYQAEQTIRSFVGIARSKAQRSNLAHYVVLNRQEASLFLVSPSMKVLREGNLASGLEFVFESEAGIKSIYVPPSGVLRAEFVRLRSRLGISEITF